MYEKVLKSIVIKGQKKNLVVNGYKLFQQIKVMVLRLLFNHKST